MLRTIAAATGLLLCLASAAACKPDPGSNAASSAAPTTSAAAATSSTAAKTAAAPKAEYPDSDLPVPEDFAAEAEKEITADNYKDKLAEIEKELGDNQAGGI